MVGLDAADWALLPENEQSERLKHAEAALRSAGAHFVVEDLPACDKVLKQIEYSLDSCLGCPPFI